MQLLSRFGILALLSGLLFACSHPNQSDQKVVQSEGIDVVIYAQYKHNIDAGIAAAAPHVPLIIPYASVDQEFYVSIKPEGREAIYVEFQQAGFNFATEDLKVDNVMANSSAQFSPDTDHLLYHRKLEDGERLILLSYINQKYPFVSSFYQDDLSLGDTKWEAIPPANDIASRIIGYEMASVRNDSSWNRQYRPIEFFRVLQYLPPENELDYLMMESINHSEHSRKYLLHRCENWPERSPAWKKTVYKNLSYLMNKVTHGKPVVDPKQFSEDLKAILDTTNFNSLRDPYHVMIIENFERGFSPAYYNSIHWEEDTLKRYRAIIKRKCEKLLTKNNPEYANAIYTLSNDVDDDTLKHLVVDELIQFWPEETAHKILCDNHWIVTDEQKPVLVEKAKQTLVAVKDAKDGDDFDLASQARSVLFRFAPCEEVRAMQREEPKYGWLRSECDEPKKLSTP